jgi:OOP family OmpA-OmpF porin
MASRFAGTVAALLFAATVQAQDSGPYIGASVGQSRAKLDTAPLDALVVGDSPVTVTEDHHTGGKVFLGYRINQYFAVEGGYADLGQFKASANFFITVGFFPGPPSTSAIPEHFTIKANGVFLSGLGGVPFLERGLVYAKLGVHDMKVELTSDIGCTNCPEGQPKSNTNVGPVYGAGVQYTRASHVGIGAEWERFGKAGGDSTGKHDFDLFTVGLFFHF